MMGKETDAQESEGGEGELAFQLLFDWYANVLQALVDSIGPDDALNLLEPYHRNASIAGFMILNDFFQLEKKDRINWSFVVKNILDFMIRSPVASVDIFSNGGITEVTDCPFRNGPRLHCILVCERGPNMTLEAFGVDMRASCVSSLSHGDGKCKWVAKIKAGENPTSENDIGMHVASILDRKYPNDVMDGFSIQYYGEWWVIATRALIDLLGEERAASVLQPYMQHSGISHGLKSTCIHDERRPLEIADNSIMRVTKALRMKSSSSMSPDGKLEGTILDCPFKEAPAAICMQFEAFCNGVCKAIDPDLRFHYDCMMTKGAKTCHWTTSKKKEPPSKKDKERASDDPANVLAQRFANGEISEEEFRSKIELLRNLGLTK